MMVMVVATTTVSDDVNKIDTNPRLESRTGGGSGGGCVITRSCRAEGNNRNKPRAVVQHRRKRPIETRFFRLSSVMAMLTILDGVRMAQSFLWVSLLSRRSPPQLHLPKTTATRNRVQRLFETAFAAHLPETIIDYQSDDHYNRGDMHLSAAVSEGDTVVYRTGSWYVDGVLVGEEDAAPAYEMCRIETIQIVWTHNCEHGVLRGLVVDLLRGETDDENQNLSIRTPLEDVEFGPEQIIARICNVMWEPNSHDDEEIGTCSISLHPSMWKEHDANSNDDI